MAKTITQRSRTVLTCTEVEQIISVRLFNLFTPGCVGVSRAPWLASVC